MVEITVDCRVVTDQYVVPEIAIDRVSVRVEGGFVTCQVRQVIASTTTDHVVVTPLRMDRVGATVKR